ncbi:MAG: aminotransferase class IV [Clostridiaceae bacterium]
MTEKIMKNNRLYEKAHLTIPQGSGLVYEVIRVIDRAALFFREHYNRFCSTARKKGVTDFMSFSSFLAMTDHFIQAQAKSSFNVKVILDVKNQDVYLFESPSSYPEKSLYESGVHTELMPYDRSDPNAKITNPELTNLAEARRRETGAYELILVDRHRFITEGSRSNVFFTDGTSLITPPLHSVLPGVTRQRIISTAQAQGIPVREELIPADSVTSFQGAFVSGTSPKILPIRSIGEHPFQSARLPILLDLMSAFDREIMKDLNSYREISESQAVHTRIIHSEANM